MERRTENGSRTFAGRAFLLGLAIVGGFTLLVGVFLALGAGSFTVRADPVPWPEGYPKLSLSIKTVTPTLAHVGDTTLSYAIEIRNTGALTAYNATLIDVIPNGVSYNNDALASSGAIDDTSIPGTVTWDGVVGFDATVVVSFSVTAPGTFADTVRNTAVISDPQIAGPVTVTAETLITSDPILSISKTALPLKPGANNLLTYTLVVVNWGQPTPANLAITVTDQVPISTIVSDTGGGTTDGSTVTWTRGVTLDQGGSTAFTFSVLVGDVVSGTVIDNASYQVAAAGLGVTSGVPYTVTIVDPIFEIAKYPWPDPPGSNREMTYTLTLLNVGSPATNLVITDRIPAGVTYRRGGSESGGVVSWALLDLDTGESAEFTYTVYVSDVMDVPIVNDDYAVRSDEVSWKQGNVLTSVVEGPIFDTFAAVYPIAKKPGGEEVTPTLRLHNVGHGNALSATVVLTFYRMSLTDKNGIVAYFADGTSVDLNRGLDCGDKCRTFSWVGDIAHDEWITFTILPGISTIGGTEGDRYVATIIVTDVLSNMTTPTATAQAFGKITHYASIVPYKEAQAVVGRGQLLTYTIRAANHGFTVDLPPVLTDTVPPSTTFLRASPGGITLAISDTVIVSWTLPLLGPGDEEVLTFTVRVDNDLVSGTQIVNRDYSVLGYGNIATGTQSSGTPVTTTVQEIGLVDSYKEVTPTTALPGPGNVLTYFVHIVNSSAIDLSNVTLYDFLPWQSSTYGRDAVASAGPVVSDIVSVRWTGDVAAFSSQIVTLTVEVDPDYQGAVTNTAVIGHPDLLTDVVVSAVAYVTEKPVLRINKSAAVASAASGVQVAYTIQVLNLGQQASKLIITDAIPSNTQYVLDSATAGGELQGDEVRWTIPVLKPGESRTFEFEVSVQSGTRVRNERYAVTCAEGVRAEGAPLITDVGGGGEIYLPVILKNYFR